MTPKELQAGLIALGYHLGPAGADGNIGRQTTRAIAAFQRDYHVDVNWPGTFGARTEVALIQALAKAGQVAPPQQLGAPLLPWLSEAQRLKGVTEIAGAKHSSIILGWAKKLGGWVAKFYTTDEIPWCGLFVAHCIGSTLPDETLPTNPLGALNWAKFGFSAKPTLGAVLVFERAGGGHVGFYVGEDDTAFHVLGGNQSNQANVTRVAKTRHVATRWPKTASSPITGRIDLTGGGKLSTNEA